MILSGTGILRLNDEERTVSQGDFIAKPAGKNIAHTFYNSSEDFLTILDVGTNESEDPFMQVAKYVMYVATKIRKRKICL
ncbi:cupin domain-containing protein [Lachnospiraceae bacterium 54-53]